MPDLPVCLTGDKDGATSRWFQRAKTNSFLEALLQNPEEFLFGLQNSALQFRQAKEPNVNGGWKCFPTSAISWLCLLHCPLITHIVIHVKKLWTLKCSHESDPACPRPLSYRFLTTRLYCISRRRKNSQGHGSTEKIKQKNSLEPAAGNPERLPLAAQS